jgi:hypothetical protein
MESVGDEKRTQALFSEQAFEDQSFAPRFEKLWLRAEANDYLPMPVLRRSVAAMVSVVLLTALSFVAAASWYRSSQPQNVANVPPQNIPSMSVHVVVKQSDEDSKRPRSERRRRPLRHRQTERVPVAETASLSNWESPTSMFLQSPTAFALSALPQLNQSARDLEMFLTNNNEVMKESKP